VSKCDMQARHCYPVNEASRPPLRLNALDRVLYCKGYDLRQCMRDGAPGLLGPPTGWRARCSSGAAPRCSSPFGPAVMGGLQSEGLTMDRLLPVLTGLTSTAGLIGGVMAGRFHAVLSVAVPSKKRRSRQSPRRPETSTSPRFSASSARHRNNQRMPLERRPLLDQPRPRRRGLMEIRDLPDSEESAGSRP
jgi:hypothetical protein